MRQWFWEWRGGGILTAIFRPFPRGPELRAGVAIGEPAASAVDDADGVIDRFGLTDSVSQFWPRLDSGARAALAAALLACDALRADMLSRPLVGCDFDVPTGRWAAMSWWWDEPRRRIAVPLDSVEPRPDDAEVFERLARWAGSGTLNRLTGYARLYAAADAVEAVAYAAARAAVERLLARWPSSDAVRAERRRDRDERDNRPFTPDEPAGSVMLACRAEADRRRIPVKDATIRRRVTNIARERHVRGIVGGVKPIREEWLLSLEVACRRDPQVLADVVRQVVQDRPPARRH